MRKHLFSTAALMALFGATIGVTGCTEPPSPAAPGAVTDAPVDEPAVMPEPAEADASSSGQYAEALAKLSPEDRVLAEKQKICPVSGEPLGSMGAPYKVNVEGRNVLLCCDGCEAAIQEDPQKYLAKLNEQ